MNFYDSDTEQAEKITQILKIFEKNAKFKGNPSFKNCVTSAVDTDIALLNVDKNNKIIRTNHRNIENQTNHFINT